MDEAWLNLAKYQSKVAYGFVFDFIHQKFFVYNVESILFCYKCTKEIEHSENECNQTQNREETSSKQLGWKCSEKMIDKMVNVVGNVN